jgi:hypothetical protein
MTVRAKFVVSSITKTAYPGTTIKLTPQYEASIPEDVRFSKATPSGELTMFIDNPRAEEFFVMGQAYYLDITAVDLSLRATA